VGCSLNQSLWPSAFLKLSLEDIFSEADQIWGALTFYVSDTSNALGCIPASFASEQLVVIDTSFSPIWRTHYAKLDEPK
jgi:hypothetical protein